MTTVGDACQHDQTEVRENGVHLTEYCVACGAYRRHVGKAEVGAPKRSVSRSKVKPRLRAEILQRFGHCCFWCGARPPAVILQLDHVIQIDVAKRFDLYDDLIESDLNLVPACEECNLGRGAEVFDRTTVALMVRALRIADKQRNAERR